MLESKREDDMNLTWSLTRSNFPKEQPRTMQLVALCSGTNKSYENETLDIYHDGRIPEKNHDQRNSKKHQFTQSSCLQSTKKVITANVSRLHITTTWNVYALLESNWIHVRSFVRVGNVTSIIFSNSKDEAWSQYKYLHDSDKSKTVIENLRCRGS
jgi:hypothetical protein